MSDRTPTFPPLLTGRAVAAGEDPFSFARKQTAGGDLGAGDLIWSEDTDSLRFALVLEPDVPRLRCGEMTYAAMVAFGDAAGALIPPEVAITYQWPNVIQMNDGQIGSVDLAVSDEGSDAIPEWMVLGMNVRLVPDFAEMNPGETYDITTLWDEGCGDITCTELLESTSRHLVNAIHTWSEDGFEPIHEQWNARLNKETALSRHLQEPDARFVGIDEVGNGLLSVDGKTVSRSPVDVLAELRQRTGAE